ncbi:patatin (plasmid) [Arthrobacter sp. ERGS1:01]|uniref:patatin-like phospholipase family protein n=1 Tax=Arthrobacter sp. ERGS1:01 TaxID=1704044 RepID=UPI0006B45776|nr:patatin-like phospholipase family protein [Arthrobacter sp. ERGS1:01]ALE04212.1 patatin [Arthrobacter sp. ERGS1:01]
MNTTPFSTPHASPTTAPKRALVLGGGGSTGNAWLIGVIAGLFEAGLDVTAAELTIGTSAGSTAAAQIAGTSPTELYASILDATPQQRAGQLGPGPGRPVVNHLERINKIIAASQDVADMRRRLGAAALKMEAASDGSWSSNWHATVAARIPGQTWPERDVLITAVDANTGEPAVFDRHGGVDLVDAIAASCSSGMPYRIGDNRYLDGGYRSNAENADLAAGYERVLVLSPFGGRSLHPAAWGTHLATQLEELRKGGSRVETIYPDNASENLFGPRGMDLSLRPPAARAGYEQGMARAGQLAEFWG